MSEHERSDGLKAAATADQWNAPAAQEIPGPSYAPATLAMGIALLLWGVVTAWPVSAVGLVLILLSLGRWVGELMDGK